MEQKEFEQLVNDFVDIYAYDYFTDVTKEFDYSDSTPYAKITVHDFYGYSWDVPLMINGDSDLVIDIGDAGSLSADSGGLFVYLFHESIKRFRYIDSEAKQKIIDLKADMIAACFLIPKDNGGKKILEESLGIYSS